jgi:hypothetical protein
MQTTFEQQLELVRRGYAIRKDFNGLAMFKYHRKVMYDYLWDKVDGLMECRGHVYNTANGKRIVHAPRKSFNYLENGWWSEVDLNEQVRIDKKFNGFMACVTKHNDEPLVTTTGSFDSGFVRLAKYHLMPQNIVESPVFHIYGATLVYEICDSKNDPHIVKEQDGAHLLGYRFANGEWLPNSTTETVVGITLGEAIQLANESKHEGFMVHKLQGDPLYIRPCKLKSPYYIGKKKLMRMTNGSVARMYQYPLTVANELPKMWRSAPEMILDSFTQLEWADKTDQERRVALELAFG